MRKVITALVCVALGAYLGVLLALSQGFKLVDKLMPDPAGLPDYSLNDNGIEPSDGQSGQPAYQPQQPASVLLEAPATSLQPADNPVDDSGTIL